MIDSLPPSKGKHFTKYGADHGRIAMKISECDHVFELVKPRQAECGCGIGFYLGHGEVIKDGHIFLKGKLVV